MPALKPENAQDKVCYDCGRAFRGGKHACFCPVCRPLHRKPKTMKWRLDGATIDLIKERYDTRVRGRAKEIAWQLGWPKWAVQRAARILGCARPWPPDRRPWTEKETHYLQTWEGVRSAEWIAKQLRRSKTSVQVRMNRLRLQSAVKDGYTARSLGRCMGMDSHVVERWIGLGWLRCERVGTDRKAAYLHISEGEVLDFLKDHRRDYRLDKVNQTWFLGLVFG